VPGILAAYRQALNNVGLSGPTCFAPVINSACDLAQATLRDPPGSPARYFILLIITDGAIMDMDQTLNAVVRASRLPLSLIIVGVGSADFDSMVALDADGGPLRGSAGIAARECVPSWASGLARTHARTHCLVSARCKASHADALRSSFAPSPTAAFSL
jgi:hypothetical protein